MKTNTLNLPDSVYATIDNSTNWAPSQDWTVEFWCARSVTSTVIFNALPWFGFLFDSNGRFNVQIGPAMSLGPIQNINTGYIPTVNSWHHYAITRNGMDNVNIFIDKVLWNAGPTATQDPVDVFPATLTLGGMQIALGDVRVWNYARCEAEIIGGTINACDDSHGPPINSPGYDYWTDGLGTGLLANWTFAETDNVNIVTHDQAWWPASKYHDVEEERIGSKTVQHDATIVGTGFTYSNDCPVNIASKPDVGTRLVTARLDYGEQAGKHSLPMMLNNAMKVFGLNADVYDESVFQNDYMSIYPEYQIANIPMKQCRIMLSAPFMGIAISDYISISGKNVNQEFKLVSNTELKEQQVIVVRYPDLRQVRLRIVAACAVHPMSQLNYLYEAVFF